MISITPVVPDGAGPFVFQEDSESTAGALESRVARRATLDGGSVIINSGVTEGDRTLTLSGAITPVQALRIQGMRATSPLVYLSSATGHYYGAIHSLQVENGELSLTFLVNQKLA